METIQEKAEALLATPLRANPTVAELHRNASRRRRRRVIASGLGFGAVVVVLAVSVAARTTAGPISVTSGPGDATTIPVTYPPGYTPPTSPDSADWPKPLIEEPLRSQIIQDSHDFADCMTRNGYPFEKALPDSYGDGQTSGGVVEVVPQFEAEWQAALEVCRPELQALQADNMASNTSTAFTPSPGDRPVAYESAAVVNEKKIRVTFNGAMCDQIAGFTVSYQPDRIIVTMYLAPAKGDCLGGVIKPVISVLLDEPIAGRTIVDGA